MKKSKSPHTNLARDFAAALKSDWRMLARPEQLPPKDFLAWSIWLFLAGRGSGKNWADSHYVHELAATGAVMRVALIGATADATRYTMVEGTAGILAAAGARDRPVFEASKGQLTWPSGCIARLYSADSPELLRGPEFDLAWCDELASWRRAQETWDNLNFCMRGGKHPHIIISTTPKPTKLIKNLVAREGVDGIVISRSSTYDNRVNLPPSFFAQLVRKYEGTRVGRQELNAELLLDTPGSLWTVENLEQTRVSQAPPMQRIVVAIDPTGSGSEDADECGIIVAGLGQNGEGYVLADESGRMTPTEWARRAIDAYRRFKADKIVAEVNFGALMIAGTIAAVDPNVPLKSITSSRGKILRAEPISTLFEQGRCHLVGSFPALEDQATSFTSDWDRSRDGSPDRVDALVFALSELMCDQPVGGFFSESSLFETGAPIDPPRRGELIFATAAASKTGNEVGVVFFASSEMPHLPALTVLDWTLATAGDGLFEIWLPSVFERLRSLHAETESDQNGGLWVHSRHSGLCAAIMQEAGVRGEPVSDIDAAAPEWPVLLDDRVSATARHIHARKVKITRCAYDKVLEHRGFTRNHFLAQFQAFRVGEDLESDELLHALCSGVMISIENSTRA